MKNNDYIVAAIGEWNYQIFQKLTPEVPGKWHFVSSPEELIKITSTLSPRYIFFPHWRWIVPKKIVEQFECVCFHMTDVPYGRGGSPLQNLIVRQHKNTKLTALRMTEELDAGPVYCKHPLSLHGSAAEIYQRASELTWQMIKELVHTNIQPTPQVGEATFFFRRKPEQSEIPADLSPEQMYDFIRMLDAPDYPKAFLKYGENQLIFDQASFENGELIARVTLSSNKA